MKNFFNKLVQKMPFSDKLDADEQLKRQVASLYQLYSGIIGTDRLVLRAGKLDALTLMNSDDIRERVLALQKLVFEDPTVEKTPTAAEIPAILEEIEEELADLMARRVVEERIEKKIADKMDERHQEYVKEIKMQVLKEENNVENPQTLKKYAELEKLEQIKLTKSLMELVRPASLAEIVGQERAIESLRSKLASPYPQHLILYGPPGVGKTTAARLVLEEAKKSKVTPFKPEAPFVEADGTTLRWDPRDMTNPLLGSVHDPIYQGAKRDLAESGVPEPKPGMVTEAHGGILFIDEIGEMDSMLQNKLLKVLEDKRVHFDSAYYDPSDAGVPKYVKKLFEEGAPADFILIGATTRDAFDISPAIRSRCAEIYFEPLTPINIEEIVYNAAKRLEVEIEPDVPRIISEYTIEGRKAVNLLSDAYSLALYQRGDSDDEKLIITADDLYKVTQVSRLTPYVNQKASSVAAVGHVFGLGVAGYLGSVIEIEAVAFPASEKGKGSIRFNDTAGSMAKDSVFNASAVVRKITGEDVSNYDIHVNVIGGGNIDGPSAGTAILCAIISAITGRKVRQDVAVTGEISIQGQVKAVGGVFEKAYGAKQAGMTTLVIPQENQKDISPDHLDLTIHAVDTVEQALDILFVPCNEASA
ncbi:MAG: Lon family ATP-dependent protease [Sporomusaceae bacterium]|nr:Lon family ATP-dependent protease [Sporomusaceae bacterium]